MADLRVAQPMLPDEPDGTVYGFMCLTDFECELGCAEGGVMVYASEGDCRDKRKCTAQCGIVKVAVRAVEIVQPEDYDHGQ